MQLRLEELHTVDSVDILFIGSSTTYRGFDPRIFKKAGITSFNLGSSAQTPIQSYYLIKKYLKDLNTELLIIDVNPLMFSIDGVESSLDIISNEIVNKELMKMAFEVKHLKVYNTLLYALYLKIIKKDEDFSATSVRLNDKYVSMGFVEHELEHYSKENYSSQKWSYNLKQFSVFERLINFLDKNKIKYLIVQSPITPNLYKSYSNNSKIDDIATKHGPYLNFNLLLQLDDSLHFSDAYHLNRFGVEKYNQFIIDYLLSDSTEYNF